MRKRKLYFGMRRRKPDRRPFEWGFEDYQRWIGSWPRGDIHIGHCRNCNFPLQLDAMALYREHRVGKHRNNYSLDRVLSVDLPNSGLKVRFVAPEGDRYRERIWPREDLGIISESTKESMPLPPGSLSYL